MFRKITFLLFLFSFFGSLAPVLANPPALRNGLLDLSHISTDSFQPISLDGEWQFNWKPESENGFDNRDYPMLINLPADWASLSIDGKNIPPTGYGYYRLEILLPEESSLYTLKLFDIHSSFDLYVNSKKIGSAGKTGTSNQDSVPYLNPTLISFEASGKTVIEIKAANFATTVGGITRSIWFGPANTVVLSDFIKIGATFFLIGSIAIIGMYHLSHYFLIRNDISQLYFGLFCFIISLRTGVTSERYFMDMLPGLSYQIWQKIEFFTFYAGIVFFGEYSYHVFQKVYSKWFNRFTVGFSGLFMLYTLVMPALAFHKTLIYYQLFSLIFVLYTILVIFLSVLKKEEGALIFLFGSLILGGAAIGDILFYMDILPTGGYFTSYGLLIFIISQVILLSIRFSRAYKSIQNLTENLKLQALAFHRFVPTQFLVLLGKNSAVDITLGDSSVQTMSVLMSDLRSFTNMAEKMSPEDTFKFLNSYLARMEPLIQKFEGFVDKFIGDAILALFAEGEEGARQKNSRHSISDRALHAAISMRTELTTYNRSRMKYGYMAIEFGIGINTGPLVLGTVGSSSRLDTTVIGNTVNLAARLESLTSFYNAKILISETTYNSLVNPDVYHIREVDVVYVKGKSEPSRIYEVYDTDPKDVVVLKDHTKATLRRGMEEYRNRNFEVSKGFFMETLEVFPGDQVASIFIERCDYYIEHPPATNWAGIYEMTHK